MVETYVIRVSGSVGPRLGASFGGMRLVREPRRTTIRGRLSPDELRHLLGRLDQLGVELLGVSREAG